MQEKSKQAMVRINAEVEKTEQVAIWTKEELHRQNQKLMKIDEDLNQIEGVSMRLKTMARRLRSSI